MTDIHTEIRQARLVLEGPIDYDAVKSIANRAVSQLENAQTTMEEDKAYIDRLERLIDDALEVLVPMNRSQSAVASAVTILRSK